MQYLVGFICLFVFLYSLYILTKDDYVLIRKSISMDQLFDFALSGIIIGFIFARILTIIFYSSTGNQDFIQQFFSLSGKGQSLAGLVFGCVIAYYLIGKYRNLPLGRLFDFVSLAFLSSLPVGYLLTVFLVKKNEIVYFLALGVLYIGIHIIFWRLLFPRIMNSRLKEGSMSILFFLIFTSVSIIASLIFEFSVSSIRFDIEDALLLGIFIICVLLLFRNERKKILRRKG